MYKISLSFFLPIRSESDHPLGKSVAVVVLAHRQLDCSVVLHKWCAGAFP